MNEVLEKGISRCFPDNECLQRMVRREFLKSKDQQKGDTVAFMAIKSIMHKKLMSDEKDIYSQCIYKLIFKESIADMKDLCEDGPIVKLMTSDPRPDHSDTEMEWDPKIRDVLNTDYVGVCTDGLAMFIIMSQKMPRHYRGVTRIRVTRKTLQIRLRSQLIADIPHRDGFEYDTYWAVMFTKLVMSKLSYEVLIEMNGEDLPTDQFNEEYMFNFLNKSILDKLPRGIPPEGWEEYMRYERRPGDFTSWEEYFRSSKPVLMLWDHGLERTNYVMSFVVVNYFHDFEQSKYWGYLREEE